MSDGWEVLRQATIDAIVAVNAEGRFAPSSDADRLACRKIALTRPEYRYRDGVLTLRAKGEGR